MSGVELQRHLVARRCRLPVVFITAHASDDHARAEAASDWTVAYLTKPFSEDELLDAVHAALKWEPSS
jgi:FixJ family two-component response regulator